MKGRILTFTLRIAFASINWVFVIASLTIIGSVAETLAKCDYGMGKVSDVAHQIAGEARERDMW
jgi:hypothetical protein